jgi:hypothetical protein
MCQVVTTTPSRCLNSNKQNFHMIYYFHNCAHKQQQSQYPTPSITPEWVDETGEWIAIYLKLLTAQITHLRFGLGLSLGLEHGYLPRSQLFFENRKQRLMRRSRSLKAEMDDEKDPALSLSSEVGDLDLPTVV